MILAGDVGGTKTDLALFEESGQRLRQVRHAAYESRAHPSLQAILSDFLPPAERPGLRSACLGVAGPVIRGRCHTTNLPWIIEEADLAQALGVSRVRLLNDLEATAYGTLYLDEQDLFTLHRGASVPKANIAVIAAGTGLGQALLYWDGARYHPIASEGGHADFAARTPEEFDLLLSLRARYGRHVSYERVLSGPGIYQIYSFLRERRGAPEPPALVGQRLQTVDVSAVVTQLALAREDAVCSDALALFCSIYGAEAGNLALKWMALGGIYVAGGIGPKILPILQDGAFLAAFVDKGRFEEFMRRITVKVVLNPRTALLGAAYFALR